METRARVDRKNSGGTSGIMEALSILVVIVVSWVYMNLSTLTELLNYASVELT